MSLEYSCAYGYDKIYTRVREEETENKKKNMPSMK